MKRALFIVYVAVFALGGCAASMKRIELMPPIPASCANGCPAQPSSQSRIDLRATTYNAGLAPGVIRLAGKRRPHVVKAIARELQRSDLVCVQEAWLPEDRQAILEAANLPAENVHQYDSRGIGETGLDRCQTQQLEAVMRCFHQRCRGVPPEDTTICGREQCTWKLVWLYLSGRPCLNCLTAMIGHSADDIVRTCVDGPGQSRAYDGSNGMLLLSRKPLRNRQVVHLPASGSNRVALLASVEVTPGKLVEVGCMHVTTHLSQSPTSGFSSWQDEQATQIRMASQALAERAQGRPQLLMGDMNFGQQHGDVNAVMWPSWKLARDIGFISPAEHAQPPLCSYCRGNRLSETGSSTLIDHVLLRQGTADFRLEPVCAEQVMSRPVRVIDRGRSRSVSLSDHFGISVGFRLRPLSWQPPAVPSGHN